MSDDAPNTSSPTATPEPTPTPEAPATIDSRSETTVSKKWLIKTAIMALGVFLLGMWGLYDALVVYPNRGIRAAEYLEYQYLSQYEKERGSVDERAAIKDPAAELTRLDARLKEFGSLNEAERPLHGWLIQLKLTGRLKPTFTDLPRQDPNAKQGDPNFGQQLTGSTRLRDLEKAWTTSDGTAKSASTLDWYDIPSQWLIMILGTAGGLYMFLIIARVLGKKFRFNHSTQTLTLADGNTITAADIAEFDKRKWHKFYINLIIKPTHPTLANKNIELDLLRYEPLESWILALERQSKAS